MSVPRSYDYRLAKREPHLDYWKLDGMLEGRPVKLYHGTTKLFRRFDMSLSRDELVNNYYGKGIFFTPSKRVAEDYAEANRNIGFDPSIIDDLKRKNPNAGKFLQSLVEQGHDAWESIMREAGAWTDDPPPGKGNVDLVAFDEWVGVKDANDIDTIAAYVLGSKVKPLGSDDTGFVNIFHQSTGAPRWIYDTLDEVGLDSKKYRPKVYTVSVTVSNPLVTASKAQARKARSKGYDAVIYYGPGLVKEVPEVAVFNPRNIQIRKIEVVD